MGYPKLDYEIWQDELKGKKQPLNLAVAVICGLLAAASCVAIVVSLTYRN